MKMKAPTPQFWAALVSYIGAVGLALSLDPTFVPDDMRGAVPRLACLAVILLGNYIEERQASPDYRRSDSVLSALRATVAVSIIALVPIGLAIRTDDVHPATVPTFTVLFVILGFVTYYWIGKRLGRPRQPQTVKRKKKRSTTLILMTPT